MTRWLALATVVASVALALVLLELGLRVFAPQPLALSYRTPEGLTLHIPGARIRYVREEFSQLVEINSLGLRDREVSLTPPPGTVRLLLLGDSHAEGKQVALEETFAERLEALLQEHDPETKWEVVNAGVSGYGTADALKYFEVYGRLLAPDLVLLAFTTGNDLRDNLSSPWFRITPDGLREIAVPPPSPWELTVSRTKGFLASRFHLVQFLRDRLPEILLSPLSAPSPAEPPEELENHREKLVQGAETLDTAWHLTEALLLRLRDVVHEAGAELLLAAVPSRFQVEDEQWARFADPQADRTLPQRRLAELARRHEIPFVDLLPALREASTDAPTHYRIDAHMNPRGHGVVARVLFEELGKSGVLASQSFRGPSRRSEESPEWPSGGAKAAGETDASSTKMERPGPRR